MNSVDFSLYLFWCSEIVMLVIASCIVMWLNGLVFVLLRLAFDVLKVTLSVGFHGWPLDLAVYLISYFVDS